MLKNLLDNQKIRVDAHQWGTQNAVTWDNRATDIHVDKTTYWRIRGKQVKVRIRIPINSERPFSVEIEDRIPDQDKVLRDAKRRLQREIAEALRDPLTRQAFIDDLIDILENYQSNMSSSERAKAAVNRLSRHFGLADKIVEDIVSYAGTRVLSFVSLASDPERSYYIQLNQGGIEAGEVPGENFHFNAEGMINPF